MRLLLRFVNWRRELLFIAVGATEMCWLYLWLALFLTTVAGAEYVISIRSMLIWLLLAGYLVRLLNNLDLSLPRQQLLTVGIGLLAILLVIKWELYQTYPFYSLGWIGRLFRDIASVWLAIPPQILVFFVGLFVWWRGIQLGQGELGAGTVGVRFRLGIVGFMLYLILAAFGFRRPYIPFLFSFFFCGLVAIALARINDLSQSRIGIRAPFNSSWLSILLGSAALVVLLGLLTSSVFSLDHVQAAFQELRPLFRPLGRLLELLILVLIYVTAFIVGYLAELLRRLLGKSKGIEMPKLDFGQLEKVEEQVDISRWLDLIKISRDILLASLVLLAILMVLFAVRRYRRRQLEGRDVTRESVWSAEDFLDDLADLLRGGWQLLRDGAAAGLARLRGDHYSLISIRKIYASLVKLAGEQGYTRLEAQTPYEYVKVLQEAWPERLGEIDLLTGAYVQAHYGERPDDETILTQAREAWSRIFATKPVVREPEMPEADNQVASE